MTIGIAWAQDRRSICFLYLGLHGSCSQFHFLFLDRKPCEMEAGSRSFALVSVGLLGREKPSVLPSLKFLFEQMQIRRLRNSAFPPPANAKFDREEEKDLNWNQTNFIGSQWDHLIAALYFRCASLGAVFAAVKSYVVIRVVFIITEPTHGFFHSFNEDCLAE